MICILSAGKTLTLAAGAFTLAWTHSVEKTRWEEHWTAGPEGLTVTEGRIEGSGAGMDPPPDAVLRDGAYVYTPHVPPIPDLVLAASGATGAGWTLCPDRRHGPASERSAGNGAKRDGGPLKAMPAAAGTGLIDGGCLVLGKDRQSPIHVRWCAPKVRSGAADLVEAVEGASHRGADPAKQTVDVKSAATSSAAAASGPSGP